LEILPKTCSSSRKNEDRQVHWHNFLILRNGIGRNELLQRALFLQTVYSMYNLLRQGTIMQGRKQYLDCGRRLLFQAAEGHAPSSKFVREALKYLPNRGGRDLRVYRTESLPKRGSKLARSARRNVGSSDAMRH
ncbi:MAG: hypothetical protein ACKPKO_31790, partial [Candidatus Fonsibacter sp.]